MVLRVDSDYTSSSSSSTSSSSAMLTSQHAMLHFPADDIEEGGYSSSSSSSYEEDAAAIDAIVEEMNHDVEMISKFVPYDGARVPRRRSQCEQLSYRQRSSSKIPPAPKTQPSPSGFRRWSTLVASSNDLPKDIQFCPTASHASSSCASSSSKQHKQRSPLLVAAGIALAALSSTVFYQHGQITGLAQELEITNQRRAYLEKSQSNLLSQLYARDESLQQFRHTHTQMARVNNDMSNSVTEAKAELSEMRKENERLRAIERRVNWSEKRWDNFVTNVQEDSKKAVVEKYGTGPHRVQFQVLLPTSSTPETVAIELAPLEKMPHAVHTFLEQVDSGLWDMKEFDLHAGHVLMAQSRSESVATSSSTLTQQEVPTLKFPEYSAAYPHDKYTLAFPSTSSKDVYINLQSNTAHHSPRVERSSDGTKEDTYIEGESAFGKVVGEESRRVVDRMDAIQVPAGNGGRLSQGVIIQSARIVGRSR